jgi:hypothetical protein
MIPASSMLGAGEPQSASCVEPSSGQIIMPAGRSEGAE